MIHTFMSMVKYHPLSDGQAVYPCEDSHTASFFLFWFANQRVQNVSYSSSGVLVVVQWIEIKSMSSIKERMRRHKIGRILFHVV
jgi:hypothetical protein